MREEKLKSGVNLKGALMETNAKQTDVKQELGVHYIDHYAIFFPHLPTGHYQCI
jgi:hypothetical protein